MKKKGRGPTKIYARICICGDHSWVTLNDGNVCFSSPCDIEKLTERSWYARRDKSTFYAVAATTVDGKRKSIYLHREIFDNPVDRCVDHINGNGLDNRRPNIRLCLHGQNRMNAIKRKPSKYSKYKGVYFNRRTKRWLSIIQAGGESFFLGYFGSENDAKIAHQKAMLIHHKEFARMQ